MAKIISVTINYDDGTAATIDNTPALNSTGDFTAPAAPPTPPTVPAEVPEDTA